jgi:thiosulfate/3-mercaptopyruvate sulfurtransferase
MHRRGVGLAMLVVAMGLATGCSSYGSALHARTDMLVSTEWLAAHLKDPNLVVLHVGMTRAGYDAAHVPGARFVAWGDVAVTRGVPNEIPPAVDLLALVRRLGIDETSRIVLYDEAGGVPAARSYVALDYLGLGDRAALLDGQWQKWTVEDRPVTTEVPHPAISAYVPRLRPEFVVTFRNMQDYVYLKTDVGGAPVAILDARPPAQYTGADPGEGIARPGHIPGAASAFWKQDIVSDERPMLKPVAALRALFGVEGARPDDTVIAYCRTGGQASHLYFTLKYAGYDARLYDGSFFEWQSAEDTQVIKGDRP